eukprot:gnl/Spiro4/23533_TR11626_c0_g1_i1.p1 gnl/Spiro4/23533_TR11626_c0_g1~~gnl/Spiro4/23533_TR11626_c0_g1_i1.p1  ORF type:complete len:381 (-),score=107.78 gnl/Spiro4/23533_TR11626_c0_g1_i1:63-1205(-)
MRPSCVVLLIVLFFQSTLSQDAPPPVSSSLSENTHTLLPSAGAHAVVPQAVQRPLKEYYRGMVKQVLDSLAKEASAPSDLLCPLDNSHRVAVLVVPGAEGQQEEFVGSVTAVLQEHFSTILEHCYGEMPGKHESLKTQVEFQPVYWASLVESAQDKLWTDVNKDHDLGNSAARFFRRLLLAHVAHGSGYPTVSQNAIATRMSDALRLLAQRTGPNAPLVVLSYGLGSVVAAEYFAALQQQNPSILWPRPSQTSPLSAGNTLSTLYTVGSPLAIYSLRSADFVPPAVPAAAVGHNLIPGFGWVNVYQSDDVFAFPLRTISERFRKSVVEDMEIRSANETGWNPFSHMEYVVHDELNRRIAADIARVYVIINSERFSHPPAA